MGGLLRGIKRDDVRRGQIIAAPGTIKSVKKIQAQIYVLTKEEGESLRTKEYPMLRIFL